MLTTALFFASAFLTVRGHMSMQIPLSRNRDASGNSYAVWQSNEPMIPARPEVCHGLPAESSVRAQNVFAAGSVVSVFISGSASHQGGHCAFWYSADDVTFTKIADVKDCTLSPDSINVQLPTTMPSQCGTRCTFAWTWVPRVSGTCEIYSNCADIRVTGLTGASSTSSVNMDFVDLVARYDQLCQRVDESTHWSSLFMPLILKGTIQTPPSAPSTPTSLTPAPTVGTITQPTPISSSNIRITNQGAGLGPWYYSCYVASANYGLQSVEVLTANGMWFACVESNWGPWTCSMWWELSLPVSVRLTSHSGERIQVDRLITTFADGASFDFGSNFAASAAYEGAEETAHVDTHDDENTNNAWKGWGLQLLSLTLALVAVLSVVCVVRQWRNTETVARKKTETQMAAVTSTQVGDASDEEDAVEEDVVVEVEAAFARQAGSTETTTLE